MILVDYFCYFNKTVIIIILFYLCFFFFFFFFFFDMLLLSYILNTLCNLIYPINFTWYIPISKLECAIYMFNYVNLLKEMAVQKMGPKRLPYNRCIFIIHFCTFQFFLSPKNKP
ncbi:hypothetical protein KUTeg_000370 [Tegillarca granosa]|uniref:Uncharacterized protein n=1 Tax=Tegillarca granosa TaxID=220873 RepID=A0ABQ9FXG2_TEGGR|nr:hypothetical protein KUTeg_000370 [Tegillarca granosa]